MRGKQKTPMTNSRFGKMGWILVIYYFLILMFNATFTADGAQIIIPALAGETGMNAEVMLTWNTIAGYFALIAYVPIGIWAGKKGASRQSGILTIITGLTFLLLGYSSNLVLYAVCLCVANIGINGAGWISCAKLTSSWFPRKKGIVMGWTTIGNNVCTILCVPLLTLFAAFGGTRLATTVFGVATVIVGILGLVLIKETPEECGLYPDNITPEQEREYGIPPADTLNDAGAVGRFTVAGILKCKEFWIIALTMAFAMCGSMASVAFATVRMQEFGFSQPIAVSINSVFALCGCLGSFLWGWLDQKISTKKAMVIFFILQIVAVVLNIGAARLDHSVPLVLVSSFLFYWCLSGVANWSVSISATLFERSDFIKAQTPFTVIFTAGRCSGFAVIALGMRMTQGALDGAYILSAVAMAAGLIILCTLNVPKFKAKYYS